MERERQGGWGEGGVDQPFHQTDRFRGFATMEKRCPSQGAVSTIFSNPRGHAYKI